MSPEQARGESLDGRSDLFSLGSVLYAMCVGHPPLRAETSFGVLRRITDEDATPIVELNPKIPDWFCRLVQKLHAKRPQDRYENSQALATDLEQCLAHLQQPQTLLIPAQLLPPESPCQETTGHKSRLPRVAWTTSIMLLVLAGGWSAVKSWPKRPAQEGRGTVLGGGVDELMPPSTSTTAETPSSVSDEWNDGVDELLRAYDRGLSELEQQLLRDVSHSHER